MIKLFFTVSDRKRKGRNGGQRKSFLCGILPPIDILFPDVLFIRKTCPCPLWPVPQRSGGQLIEISRPARKTPEPGRLARPRNIEAKPATVPFMDITRGLSHKGREHRVPRSVIVHHRLRFFLPGNPVNINTRRQLPADQREGEPPREEPA